MCVEVNYVLVVTGIPYYSNVLERSISRLFGQYGEVVDVCCVISHKSMAALKSIRVTMRKQTAAYLAVEKLNNSLYEGQIITVIFEGSRTRPAYDPEIYDLTVLPDEETEDRQSRGFRYDQDKKQYYQDRCQREGALCKHPACKIGTRVIKYQTKQDWAQVREAIDNQTFNKGDLVDWFTVDHIYPCEKWERSFFTKKHRGPDPNEIFAWYNCRKNWQPMHWGCNSSKHDKVQDARVTGSDSDDDAWKGGYAANICICPHCPHSLK